MNTSESCLPSADSVFGPVVNGCRDFDFTFAFEQYIFSIVPSVLFLLAMPVRLRKLYGKPKRVNWTSLRLTKLSTIAVFAILQLTLLCLWSKQPSQSPRVASIAALSLLLVTSLVFCALSYIEHTRSTRPSILLNSYLLISLVFDAAMLRTLWLTPFDLAIRNIFTASFTLKAVILLLEAAEKQKHFIHDHDKQLSPEETSGLYSHSTFWWLNTLILRGYRTVISPDDLYPVNDSMTADVLNDGFEKAWAKSSRRGKHKLTFVALKFLKSQILITIVARLFLLGFTFCQPLLVSRFLTYLQDPSSSQDASTGWALVGAYFLVYLGIAITTGAYWHMNYKALTMLRGALVTCIYSKTTEISITALDNSAAITLMSTDVERIIRGLGQAHELWANIIQIALSTWLLERQVGLSCLAPAVVAAVTTCVMVRLSALVSKRQKKWVVKIQKRVGITTAMLGAMKGVKMSGLTERLSNIITDLRVEELQAAKSFRYLQLYASTLAYVPQMWAPVFTFIVYTLITLSTNATLDTNRLFTSLSLLTLLTQPLFITFAGMMDLISTFGCFERIENFLSSETRSDHRLIAEEAGQRHSGLGDEIPGDVQLVTMPPKPSTSNIGAAAAIRVCDSSFGWKDDEMVLHNINIDFPSSSLTLIIGPVASGKSTLLKALLGETPTSKGFVHVSTSEIAWCEQSPWLINASVQENIIAFSEFDEELYSSVVFAADLEDDIAIFPNGSQTLIGSKGITLSGGQKQRLAIARAVYARKSIAIFDDIFSGLDSTTEKAVFSRLFGLEGLLRRWGTTVIVATHAVNLLPYADLVVALGTDGKVAEQGSFVDLNAKDGYVKSFCIEHVSKGVTNSASHFSDELKVDVKLPRGTPEKTPAAIKALEQSRQTGDMSVYKYYFDATRGLYATPFFFFAACWGFFSTFPTVWLKWWSDANEQTPNQSIGMYLSVYAALQTIGLLTNAANEWFCFIKMAVRAGLKLHNTMLETVLSAPMAFFSVTDTGSITTKFSQDLQLIDGQLPLALMCTVSGMFICVAQALLISSSNPYLYAAFPVLLAVFYCLQRFYLMTSRQLRLLDLEEKAPIYTQFIESLGGLATIRAFGWQTASIKLNHKLVNRSQRPFYLLFMIQRWLTLVLDLTNTVLAVFVVVLAVRLRDTVSVGFTGVSLTQIISFTGMLKLTISFWTQLETSIGAITRVKQFESETQDENLPAESNEPPNEWPSQGCIEIKGISASYTEDSDNKALNGVSLSIAGGQRIGICGRTGSGKSSLVLSLFRMIELSTGTITIDGLDITTIPRQCIRSRLNGLAQDPFFLHGTVRLNLDPFESINDDAAIQVLQKVELWSAIEAKGGLDVEFDIDMLSHGQRQLFCLARAILRPGKIVVLDEATSSVDRKTDELIQKIIRSEFKNHTIIAIAHRLETILDFDKIVVMDKGLVAEFDSLQELFSRQSRFKELYESSKTHAESEEE